MNEVSIIINGVRYDLVKIGEPSCDGCERPAVGACGICTLFTVFKKSTKSFEP